MSPAAGAMTCDVASSIAAGEGAGVEDVVVRNDRPVGTVAREVMSWLGWM
jgi:hypothetical protein